jgi:NTE family protein
MRPAGFAAGDVLVRQGEATRRLFLITSGTVTVALGTGADARVIARLGRGSWIGETALLTGSLSSTTVVAESDVRVLVVSQRDFLAAAGEDPAIFREVARELAHRLRSADEIIDHTPQKRLVGLRYRREHAQHVERVIDACRATASGRFLVLGFGAPAAGAASVRDYALDSTLYGPLRSRVSRGDAVAIQAGDAAAEDVDGFLRMVAEFSELVIAYGCEIPRVVRAHFSHLVTFGDVRTLDHLPPAVHHSRVSVDGAFDAGRVARRICGRSVGVAFGGGGARGFAHIGVLRVLAEAGVPIDAVSGTSVGAGVAAGLAKGRGIEEMANSIQTGGRGALLPSVPPIHSSFSSVSIERELRRQFDRDMFEDLGLPLAVVAVDLISGEEMTFTSGPLVPALMASMAVPGIFPPVRHQGRILVDGALHQPVPVRACRGLGADIVIASQLRVEPESVPGERRALPWMPEVITAALDIMQEHIAGESVAGADVRIESVIRRDIGGLLDFSQRRSIERTGEEAARRVFDQLCALVPASSRAA